MPSPSIETIGQGLAVVGTRVPEPRAPESAHRRVSLLGGFQLEVDGQLARVPVTMQKVVSMLALRGRCGRSRLAGSLWPETMEGRALASLRTALWRANQVAPGLVEPRHDSVGLAEDVEVDVHGLVRAAHEVMEGGATLPLDAPMLTLLDGDLLPDWRDDWLVVDRERLRQLRLHLLEAVAQRLAEQRMFGMAMEAALAALRSDVLRESAHRAVIRVHLLEGNLAEAASAFAYCRDLLRREIGVAPSEETLHLVRGVNALGGERAMARALRPRPHLGTGVE